MEEVEAEYVEVVPVAGAIGVVLSLVDVELEYDVAGTSGKYGLVP